MAQARAKVPRIGYRDHGAEVSQRRLTLCIRLRRKSYKMLSYWVVLVSPPCPFVLSATHPAAVPRKIAVFLGGRLAKLVHQAAQLKVFRLVGHVADKPPAAIDPRLCHQCLELALAVCIPLRRRRKRLAIVSTYLSGVVRKRPAISSERTRRGP